jgi:hypothetical protein
MPSKKKADSDTVIADETTDQVYWLKKIFNKLVEIEKNQQDLKETFAVERREINCPSSSSPVNCRDDSVKRKSTNFQDDVQNEWGKLFTTRKHAYYNQLRSQGIGTIYQGFLDENTPFIPRKFREKQFPGQSDSQTKRIKELETKKIEIEIERLQEQSSKQETIMEDCERSIKSIINRSNCPETRQSMSESWIRDVTEQERVSMDIWSKKKFFFTSMKERESDNIDSSTGIDQDLSCRTRSSNYPQHAKHHPKWKKPIYNGTQSTRNDKMGDLDVQDMFEGFLQYYQNGNNNSGRNSKVNKQHDDNPNFLGMNRRNQNSR